MRSWKEIDQSKKPTKAVTPFGRRRLLRKTFKVSQFVLLILLVTAAAVWIVYHFQRPQASVPAIVDTEPIRWINVATDGVLDLDWFRANFPSIQGQSLINLDHFALKREIEKKGQILAVSIEKRFPDQLTIRLREREPILRIRLAAQDGKMMDWVIATDGAIFEGKNHSKVVTDRLPFLEINRFVRTASGPQALERELEVIAPLLNYAKRYYPRLYETWQVISCKHLKQDEKAPGSIIKIRSQLVDEIFFTSKDFEKQLVRLAQTINYYGSRGIQRLASVDLSLEGSREVVVQVRSQ